MIPGNPYVDGDLDRSARQVKDPTAQAVLALAYEQHQRNRLAAIAAINRAIALPSDLAALADIKEKP